MNERIDAIWMKIARLAWIFIFTRLEVFIESMAKDLKDFIMSDTVDKYVDDIYDMTIKILVRNLVQLLRDYLQDIDPDDIFPAHQ